MVMRYIPSLQGVFLAHSNIRFLSQTASIHGDCPFAICNVTFDAAVWGPGVSMKLVGRINLYSPDHVSLLVHRTFNVSIPRHHIPQDQWVFEYGPAANDPEFGEGMDWNADGESKGTEGDAGTGDAMRQEISQETSRDTQETESSGHWVHHLTGSKLGDPDGYVEFTVIGLTMTNEMISLQESIQPPFSLEHVPHPNKEPSPALARDEMLDVEDHHGSNRAEDEDESDEDTSRYLAKLSDEARAAQKAKLAQEEAERVEKARKRKRRESSRASGEEADKNNLTIMPPRVILQYCSLSSSMGMSTHVQVKATLTVMRQRILQSITLSIILHSCIVDLMPEAFPSPKQNPSLPSNSRSESLIHPDIESPTT